MELSEPSRGYEDVLGFTKQTGIFLTGMGAQELIPEFKRRNISTEVMAELTVEDLQLLGADCKLAEHMRKELIAISKRFNRLILTPQQRFEKLSEILVINNKHLSLIQAFITYARLRIKKERIDSFIEMNNNLRSSKALELAVEATIVEVQDARLALQELKQLFEDNRPPRKPGFYLAMIGGTGIIALIILKKLT